MMKPGDIYQKPVISSLHCYQIKEKLIPLLIGSETTDIGLYVKTYKIC